MAQRTPNDMPRASPPMTLSNEDCLDRLKKHIGMESKGLSKIITDELTPSSIYVETAARMFAELVKPEFGCPGTEIGTNLMILTLYDIVILIDDSFSMKKDPKLLPSLESVIEQICEIYELANPDGINSIRFMNHHQARRNVKKADIKSIIKSSPYTGVSRIGTELKRRVLDTFVLDQDVAMTKPLLVLTFTDGVIEGEKVDLLTKVIMKCLLKTIQDPQKGGEAVAFQFICLGEDEGAQKFFQLVDDHERIGHRVDCVLPGWLKGLLKDPQCLALIDVCIIVYHKLHTINDVDEWNSPNGRKWPALSKILLGALLANFDNHDEDLEISDIEDFSAFEGEEKRKKGVVEDD